MHYPHDREERKTLYSSLIDHVHSDLFLESVAALVLGVLITLTAIIDSLFLHTKEQIAPLSWLLVWTLCFLAVSLSAFLLPKLLPSHKQRKLYGIKRSFVIKNTFPTLLLGSVTCWSIGISSSQHLPTAASLACIFYALTLFSRTGYSMPSLKYYAISIAVLGMSFLVLLMRHTELVILPQHVANLFLIVGLGLPSIAFGAWKSFIKRD